MVVEDEATIAGAIAARLRAEGFDVEIAGDGPAGVALCARLAPDLVILDWMLPGLDGVEVCRRIRSDVLDLAGRRFLRDGAETALTPTELDLLAALAVRPGRALTRDELLAEVWAWRSGGSTRTVDSHVAALRRKLGAHVVRTVTGHGYALGDAA